MIRNFYPNQSLSHFQELDLAQLQANGITMILSDLDNTLVPDGVSIITPELQAWLAELAQRNIKIIIVSNNKSEKRVKDFAEPLGLEYYYKAGKPNPRIYEHIFQKHAQDPAATVMLGDRLTTDVFGGNKMGMQTVLVAPIDPHEPVGIRFMRVIETILKLALK